MSNKGDWGISTGITNSIGVFHWTSTLVELSWNTPLTTFFNFSVSNNRHTQTSLVVYQDLLNKSIAIVVVHGRHSKI